MSYKDLSIGIATDLDEAIEVKLRVGRDASYGEIKKAITDEVEIQFIELALAQYHGNKTMAARNFRMDRKHLCDLCSKHGIDASKFKRPLQSGLSANSKVAQ